jgi:5-carboxymethyl-2-hydroxymuconate isomerase
MNLSNLVLTHIASATDVAIMAEFLAFCAIFGVLLASFSNRFFFGNTNLDSDALFEMVERSIFAFLVFLLAITLGDVRANFSKAEDSVVSEALEIRQYLHLLDLQKGSFPDEQKDHLNTYLNAVVNDEWRSLAQANPSLSVAAEQAILSLRKSVKKNVQESGMSSYTDKILTSLSKLENARLLRYQLATASSPRIFWLYIAILMLLGCVAAGRTKLDRRRTGVLAAYFGALGMVVGLIMIMDQPFRGETSISSAPFRTVIEQMRVAS